MDERVNDVARGKNHDTHRAHLPRWGQAEKVKLALIHKVRSKAYGGLETSVCTQSSYLGQPRCLMHVGLILIFPHWVGKLGQNT